LAARLRAGIMVGEDFETVPADLRFYAGGGGSVRGYEYQTAGPLDRDEDPLGGRSLLETSVELRRRLTDKIGLVTFVDSGTVYRQGWPDFSEPLRVGAGIGVRYATPMGPLRLDLATPINRRDGVDPAIQVYFGFGQAF
ncbi:MAG TPA: BamA/TamA family outer membrane protein, partial [Candidatus Hydrogenedentes bacterium]|nr:BamA/TamA family outer membrane protein [Candidatus Hydrogenedentota bacterium]